MRLRPATHYQIMFKIRSRLGYIRRLGWDLGSTADPPHTKPGAGAHPDTWLSSLESHVWGCWTHVNDSKHVAQVGCFYYYSLHYALLNLQHLYCLNTVTLSFLPFKKWTVSQVAVVVALFLCLVWMWTLQYIYHTFHGIGECSVEVHGMGALC